MFMRAAVVAVTLLLSLSGANVASQESDTQDRHALTEVPERPAATDFSLKDTEGNIHTLSQYLGKPVVINFWASWCRPCRQEMPALQRAWEKLKGEGAMVLAINLGDKEEWIPKFRASFSMTFDFPILVDKKASLAKDWSVKGLPLTYVIDAEGKVVYVAAGEREWDSPVVIEKILALKN